MNIVPHLALGAFGALVGSFLNVVADRVPAGGSIVNPPSHCPNCGRRLQPLELIPIVSYLVQRGRCRQCDAAIPKRVVILEGGTALLFIAVGVHFGARPFALLPLAFGSLLLVMAVIDCEHHRIPNPIVFPAIGLALAVVPLTPGGQFGRQLLGGAVTFTLLFILAALLPKGMGMGDVKLAAFVGLILGFPAALLFLLLAFVTGGLVAGLLLITNRLNRSDPIPFGPFLALAGLAGLFWSDPLVTLWLGSA